MTIQEIIKIILVALMGAFGKSFFDHNIKRINSMLKKYLLLAIRYALPVCFIIDMYISDIHFDKWFVFRNCLLFCIIFFNVVMDFFSRLLDITKDQVKIHEVHANETANIAQSLSDYISLTRDSSKPG